MKRTTIYLAPDLEVLLKLEVQRQGRPMAEIIREAVEAYVVRAPRRLPPGAGEFESGHTDTADRAEEMLDETGFGARAASPSTRTRAPQPRGRRRRA